VTKSDFIDTVANRSGLSKKDAGAAVDAVLESIKDSLAKGDDVVFTGFGKFSV
jgi:DNA-binding protein HU-beta